MVLLYFHVFYIDHQLVIDFFCVFMICRCDYPTKIHLGPTLIKSTHTEVDTNATTFFHTNSSKKQDCLILAKRRAEKDRPTTAALRKALIAPY